MYKLFQGLEDFGFDDLKGQDLDLFSENKNEEEVTKNSVNLDDYIFLKSFVCPVCEREFSERVVKKSKLRILSHDTDLKPVFENIIPAIYDVIHCTNCGYTALTKFFDKIVGTRAELIRQKVTPDFKPKEYPSITLSLDDGIERHKLALYNALVKKAKSDEKAFICMKLAWLYRDKSDKINELLFISAACQGLVASIDSRHPTVCDMDKNTVRFLIACFYKSLGNSQEAYKWLLPLISSKTLHHQTRQRVMDLKYEIQQEKQELEPKKEVQAEEASSKPKISFRERILGVAKD